MKQELTLLNTEFETIHDGLPNVLLFKILRGVRGKASVGNVC